MVSLPSAFATPTHPHASFKTLLLLPSHPRGTLLLLTGGTGRLDLKADGHFQRTHNILLRIRRFWTAQNYAVLIPDIPTSVTSLRGKRHSAAYGKDLATLEVLAHQATPTGVPVYVFGTSQGTIGAVLAGAQTPDLSGIALLEPLTVRGKSHETVFEAQPDKVRSPVLIVVNEADHCPVTPPEVGKTLVKAFPSSARTETLVLKSPSLPQQFPCASHGPHGEQGQEERLEYGLLRWLNTMPHSVP